MLYRYICLNREAVGLGEVFAENRDKAKSEFWKYCKDDEFKGMKNQELRVRRLNFKFKNYKP